MSVLGNIIAPYTLSVSGQGKCAARDNDLPRSNFLGWDSATFSFMQTDGLQISPLIINSRFPAGWRRNDLFIIMSKLSSLLRPYFIPSLTASLLRQISI